MTRSTASLQRSQNAAFVGFEASPRRGRLVRRVILFQIKLMADGFRDLVMSPLSIAAGILGLLSPRGRADVYFDRLMRFGRDTDHWINLFDHRSARDGERAPSLDRVADEIEAAIRRDYQRGGLSARGAEALAEVAMRLRRS